MTKTFAETYTMRSRFFHDLGESAAQSLSVPRIITRAHGTPGYHRLYGTGSD